jgi:excisionase family DNA binding protein
MPPNCNSLFGTFFTSFACLCIGWYTLVRLVLFGVKDMIMKPTPLVLTINETAQLLRIQRAKVYLLIQDGCLQASKVGNTWRVRASSIEALIGPISREIVRENVDHESNIDSITPIGKP